MENKNTIIEKKELRTSIRAAIKQLPDEYCQSADRCIRENVLSWEACKKAATVFCFVGTKREINTLPLIEALLQEQKRMLVPLCRTEGEMDACEIRDISALVPGSYGILEPPVDSPVAAPEEIDLILVPCVACTRTGVRLGQGGGYYDRYFEKTNAVRAVLCRERILQQEIPREPHDIRMEYVITESGVVSCDISG